MSSGFGLRNGTMHRGVDYAGPLGAPIYAAADGVVVEGSERANVGGFGNWVWIRHDGFDTIYGHMYQKDIVVTKGYQVKRGQPIARIGNNGDSTGPHLHFEVWLAPGRVGGVAVDPAPLIG